MTETTENNVQTTPAKEVKNPFDNAILLSVTIRKLGVSRQTTAKEKEKDIVVDADKDMLTVSKVILDCEEYEAIKKAEGEIKKYLNARAIPGVKFLKNGIHPIPLSKIEEIDQGINERIPIFNAAVTRFCEVYEARKEEGKARLRTLGESVEYPPIEKVKAAFGIETNYVSIGAPGSIAGVSKELYDREKSKIAAQCQTARDAMQTTIETMFADIVDNMMDSLTPKADGTKKKFYESAITKFKDYFAKIEELKQCRIVDSTRIDDLAAQAKALLAGKSVESFRKDDAMRELVKEKMGEFKLSLTTMLQDVPSRAIILDD